MGRATSEPDDRLLAGLSDEQRAAVSAAEKYVRLVAAAGAGKTETLTRRILFLLGQGAEPRSVVAFTFTEKAAAEMKQRIYRRGEELLAPEVVSRLGDMYVGTIHAFCARLLQDFYGYGNFTVLDENQEVAFLMQHGWGLGLGKLPGRYSDNCLRFLESEAVVCNEGLRLEDVSRTADHTEPAKTRFAERVNRYWRLLDEHRLLTFGRLVRLAVENLEQNPVDLPYRHIVVDEFQDINPAQEQLIQLLASRAETSFVVGDPRQCIYEWRGSDPACFDRFAARFGAKAYTLNVNRRSARSIIEVANRVAGQFEAPDLRSRMDALPTAPDGYVLYLHCPSPADEADYVADAIRNLVESGVCRYRDIAVLLRSVSTSGPEFTRAFREREIPYLVLGKIGLFRRPEAEALACLWVWCAGLSWWGTDGDRYAGDDLLGRARQLWPEEIPEDLPQLFRDYLLSGSYGDLIEAFYDLLAELGVGRWDPDHPGVAVRLANLGRLSHVIGDFQAAFRRGGRRAKWDALVRGLAWYLVGYASSGYAEQLPDPAPDVDAVYLGTVHQAKGLEWPVVFVPALVSGRFPSSRAGTARDWLVSRELFDARRYEGGEDAERKLFFVAVTRARDVLVLSRFDRQQKSRTPSPFLREVGLPAQGVRPGDSFPRVNVRPPRLSEETLHVLTVGDVVAYLRCPHQYRLRNLWGYEAPLRPDIGFGRSVHHVLRVLAERARDRGDDPLAVLDEVLREHFHLPFRTPEDTAAVAERIRTNIEVYLADHPEVVTRADEVEARLEFLLDGQVRATLSGRVDVLQDAGSGHLEVVDYKTAEDDDRTEREAALQLRLYALGLTKLGRPVIRARIDAVMENRVIPVDLGESVVTEVEALARRVVEGICKRAFRPGVEGCSGRCDVGRICPWA